MGKLKTMAILLLTCVLIAAGANLPKIVWALQDRSIGDSVQYGTVQPVELVLSEERETLPMIGKLALLREGFYRIPESDAEMTPEEVTAAMEKALAPYYEWELIPYNWADAEVSTTPYFVNDPEHEDRYAIFWEVAIAWNLDSGYYLNLYLDDETGSILRMDYKSGTPLDIYDLQSYLVIFCDLFFESLGMSEAANYLEDMGLVENISTDSAGTVTARYAFGDMEYGEVVVDFNVYSNGFYSQVL